MHLLDACKGDARVSWRVYVGARVSSWCTHVLDCALAQGDAGVWSPLLCTLVQCRCGHSSPKDAGVRAQKMQASEPKCLHFDSSMDTGVRPCVLARALTLELTFPLDI